MNLSTFDDTQNAQFVKGWEENLDKRFGEGGGIKAGVQVFANVNEAVACP